MTRREYPGVNDAIVEAQRRAPPAALLGKASNLRPAPAVDTSSARVAVRVVRRSLAPVVQVSSRFAGRIPDLERELVLAYNTPGKDDARFLKAASDLAEALMADSSNS